jgi:prepilin-type N-terminal cleavage/methylation domain-containing protein
VSSRTEAGFTLIELVVAVSILAVVMGALSGVFITLLRIAPTTASTYSDSHDAQLAGTNWTTDVESAEQVLADTPCRDPVGGADLLGAFQWTTPDGTVKVVAYRRRPGPTVQEDVIRTFCTQAQGSRPVPQVSAIVAHQVDPAGTSVSCADRSCTLTVTEASGYRFVLGATRRVAP